jgi:hypothetical protein
MSIQKIDALFPCVARRGIVKLANAVAYPTNDGIAVYSPFGGSQLITKYNYNDDTWKADLDPSTIIAGYYNEAYFASFGNASQAPGAVPEPTPPVITEPAMPPAPLGGPIDGGENPSEPGNPEPSDPTVLYEGTVVTEYWTEAGNNNYYIAGKWYGFIESGVLEWNNGTPVAEHGDRFPEFFYDNTRRVVEVTAWWGMKSFLDFEVYTRVSIGGYTADPIGTPDEPVLFTVGDVSIVPSTRNTYYYDNDPQAAAGATGIATWRWKGDKFGIYEKTGLVLPIVIRKAP